MRLLLASLALSLCAGCFSQPTILDTDSGGEQPDLRVFVTPSSFTGSLGGLEGADNVCQGIADGVFGEGRWVAWLSTAETAALDRIQGEGPWMRVDGETAFASRAQLSAGPTVPLSLSAEGESLEGNDSLAWTGTTVQGDWADEDCAGWTSAEPEPIAGIAGEIGLTGARWTNADRRDCGSQRSLYCFEVWP